MFDTIVAVDNANGIGKDGRIPWHYPEDMKFFKNTTINQIVIMGKATFKSIGHPLPCRINCIISTTMPDTHKGVHLFRNPWDCVRWCEGKKQKKYVIGGESIYKWFLNHDLISNEYVTHINKMYECDRFYPSHIKYDFEHVIATFGNKMIYNNIRTQSHKIVWRRIKNQYEQNMLDLIKDIITFGDDRIDRTGVGTRSLFGHQLRFNLVNNTFPLMTTRRMFTRGIFEELMLYIRGETNSKILEARGVNIWKDNTTREFLDNKGLKKLPVGDMGHSYGFSFRHYGAEYKDCNTDYTDQGFDQIKYAIDQIKNNPSSRRIIIDLWEPNHMHNAALPPCLYNYQFYVQNGNLTCMMTQRSSDIVLAGGWNIATGAFLTYILAHYTGTKPKQLIWNIGDVHIYKNGLIGAREQYGRMPNVYPRLFLRNMPKNINDVEWKNVEILNYMHQGIINIPMNA